MHKTRSKVKIYSMLSKPMDFGLKRSASVFHNLCLNEISTNNYNNYKRLLIINAYKPVHSNSTSIVEERLFLLDPLRASSHINSLSYIVFSFSSRNIYRLPSISMKVAVQYTLHSLSDSLWFLLMTSRSRYVFSWREG